jgi:hypothetical protein
MPFDYPHFRAAVFAAYVRQDWDAVGNALALMQGVTGQTIISGDPTPAEVDQWAAGLCAQLAEDGKYLDEHGEVHPRLQCQNPRCGTHGAAVRARLARKHADALSAPGGEQPEPKRSKLPLILLPPIPGEH